MATKTELFNSMVHNAGDVFCEDICRFLSITEQRQDQEYEKTKKRPYHICLRYKKNVYHFLMHPKLYRLDECTYKK